MKRFYLIFLILFLVFIGFNLYSIDWQLGFMHEENSKFILSMSAGIVGVFAVFVLNMWSKLSVKK